MGILFWVLYLLWLFIPTFQQLITTFCFNWSTCVIMITCLPNATLQQRGAGCLWSDLKALRQTQSILILLSLFVFVSKLNIYSTTINRLSFPSSAPAQTSNVWVEKFESVEDCLVGRTSALSKISWWNPRHWPIKSKRLSGDFIQLRKNPLVKVVEFTLSIYN